jgi:hypothetical protein
MILEHSQAKAVVTADIARHGGEVAKVMASQKKAWKRDFEVMSSLGVHCELTMLADNACSPAAHAQNGQLFGTPEMEAYYKSRRDFKSHVGDAYTFILSAKGRAKEADEHKSRVAQWEREEACKNPNKMKGLVANMLMKLFGELDRSICQLHSYANPSSNRSFRNLENVSMVKSPPEAAHV